MKKLMMIMAVAVFFAAAPAWALIQTDNTISYQRTQNRPCVIGDSSCPIPNGWLYTQRSGTPEGTTETYVLDSPIYQVIAGNQVAPPNSIPSVFKIGIDDNYARGAGPETLEYFKVFVSMDGVHFSLDGTNSLQTPYLIAVVEGNGYSDVVL